MEKTSIKREIGSQAISEDLERGESEIRGGNVHLPPEIRGKSEFYLSALRRI